MPIGITWPNGNNKSGIAEIAIWHTQNSGDHVYDHTFGLGYVDGDGGGNERTGKLTHSIWCNAKNAESGPYTVNWMSLSNDN